MISPKNSSKRRQSDEKFRESAHRVVFLMPLFNATFQYVPLSEFYVNLTEKFDDLILHQKCHFPII